MRTFISINPDIATKEKILDIRNDLRKQLSEINEKFLRAINWTGKDNFHLTLFFIGEINENKMIKIDHSLSKLQPDLSLNEIEFTFKGINAFPNLRYPRVLHLELINKDKKILELSEKINLSLKKTGLTNDKKLHPHITLGRVRRDHKLNLTKLKTCIDCGSTFSVREFYLMESKLKNSGSEYSILRKYSV